MIGNVHLPNLGDSEEVFWRIAYGDEMPPDADLKNAVANQLKTALRRSPSAKDIDKMSKRLKESIQSFGKSHGTPTYHDLDFDDANLSTGWSWGWGSNYRIIVEC